MLNEIHIFDIDGVLLSSAHRFRIDPATGRIDLAHWRANDTDDQIANDQPLYLAQLYRALIADATKYVIVATARVCKTPDFKIVDQLLGWPDRFYWRAYDDTRGGAVLKILATRWLKNLKPFKNLPIYIWEDNFDYGKSLARFHNKSNFFPVASVQGV